MERGVFQNANWNFDGVHRFQNLGVYTNYTLTNFWNGFFEHGWDTPTQSDNATRGGPYMELPGGWWVAGGIFTNFNEPTRYGLVRRLGRTTSAGGTGGSTPSSRSSRPTA